MDDEMKLYSQMLATANSVNEILQWHDEFNLIGRDTAAKILAVVYIQGGDERMVLSPKLKADCDYIQERYHIQGGEVPDKDFVLLIQKYTKELKEYTDKNNGEWPTWLNELIEERYGFKPYKL